VFVSDLASVAGYRGQELQAHDVVDRSGPEFGAGQRHPKVVKVGMIRRLEPMDRVREQDCCSGQMSTIPSARTLGSAACIPECTGASTSRQP
jgi:hypothetical protein